MPLPNYIGSREDWAAEQERQLRAAFAGDKAGFQRAWQHRYPTSVAGAVAELRSRGLSIDLDTFPHYCDLDSLQRLGRSYLLRAEDIDQMAETLFEAGKVNGLALKRKNAGISYSEEMGGIRHIMHQRRCKAAEAIGISVEELHAAIRCGGISDPAYTTIDTEAAKAWIENNAGTDDFQHELQTQEAL